MVGRLYRIVSILVSFSFVLVPLNTSSLTVDWESVYGDKILYDNDSSKTICMNIYFGNVSYNRSVEVLQNDLIPQQIFHIITTDIANYTVALNVPGTPSGEYDIPIRIKYNINDDNNTHRQNITVTYRQSFDIELVTVPDFISEEAQEIAIKMEVHTLLTNVSVKLDTGIGIKADPSEYNFEKLFISTYIIRSNISKSDYIQSPYINEFALSLALEIDAEVDTHKLSYRSTPIFFKERIEVTDSYQSNNILSIALFLLLMLFLIAMIILYYRRRSQ